MEFEELLFGKIGGNICVPILHYLADGGEHVQHLLRGIYAERALIMLAFAAFNISFFLELCYLARDSAFVDADVLCKCILGHTGIVAYGKNIAVVAGAKICFFELVRPINSFASAENIYFPHK